MTDPVYLLVQGMYLRSDSIAYDAAFQLRRLREWGVPATMWAEEFDAENYPGIDARPFSELAATLRRAPGLVVYHWVDGWYAADDFLLATKCRVVLRWHNNTPPWFFASHSRIPTHKTVRGFQELLRVARAVPDSRLWVNSEFSRRQLAVLGVDEGRVDVVHPASAYLEADLPARSDRPGPDEGRAIRLLFVGRVVPHKGHRHVIAAAAALSRMCRREVRVHLPGRPDGDMPRYVPELRALAARLGVSLDVPGELGHAELEEAYRDADVFVGLSEHEGFGLPYLEAMTRHLPVVGYLGSAVREVLAGHPLAVDDLDPAAVARRIAAALDPAARRAVVEWQERFVLPRFSREAIAGQMATALERAGRPVLGAAAARTPANGGSPCPPEVAAALERSMRLPEPDASVPRDLPRDSNPHFVTHYDLDAYRALLGTGETGDLRGRALAMEFSSHRETMGGVMGLLKRGMLRLQDGLIRTIELSHDDLQSQLRTMSDRVESLAAEIERLRSDRSR